MTVTQNLKTKFCEKFGEGGEIAITKAPGRINIIGEHTDYNEGFVLPMTIDRSILLATRRRKDCECRFFSLNFNEEANWSIGNIERTKKQRWANYIKSVMKTLIDDGAELGGVEGVVWGNIPIGAGLSSSAALEIATTLALKNLFKLKMDNLKMVKLAQYAENNFVGVNCGIMDQFVCLLGRKNNALFIDCKTLEYQHIPLNLQDACFIIVDTKVKRELSKSVYNKRVRECKKAVCYMKSDIKSLRDANQWLLRKYKSTLPQKIYLRAEHVVTENQRVIKAVEALRQKDIQKLGSLLYESHESLCNRYEVSCDELNFVVESVRKEDRVYGARMTGAGFGGSVIILANKKAINKLTTNIKNKFKNKFGYSPNVYINL